MFWGRITSRSITLYDFFLCTRMHMFLKKQVFFIHFYITHQNIYLNSVLLKEEEKGKEKKAFLLKLLSEGRVLLQFHIQALSSAHQCLFSSTEPTVTVTLF